MSWNRTVVTAALLTGLLSSAASQAHAQSMVERLKQKAEEAARKKAEELTEKKDKKDEKKADKKSDSGDDASADKDEAKGSKEVKDADEASAEKAAMLRPGEGAWANYDFIPGEKPILIDDFSKDNVGDFPRRLEFSEGSLEIVTWKGARWLRGNGSWNRFLIPAPAGLPARYTLEFDVAMTAYSCSLYPSGSLEGPYFTFDMDGEGGLVTDDGRRATAEARGMTRGEVYTARIMVDNRYAKVFVNDQRVANVPNLDGARGKGLFVSCSASVEDQVMIGNIRFAAGGRKLYDALLENGRVATQGILFDSNSDRVRPESTPTLKEIAGMLSEHPDLKLLIEGHTDNVGSDAANLTLSDKRAAAVKAALVTQFKVDAARLTTQGFGAGKPVAPNTTPEGRQTNRRVELVKR